MRDGTELAADVYRPSAPGRRPALLFRTPYGRALPALTERLRSLASYGYAVVANDVRGCGDSEGIFDWYNFEHGPWDGYDSVEWIAGQPWCDGNVGMFGGSGPGVYCWCAAITHPPHLKAMFLSTGASTDGYREQWYIGGVFQARNRINWSALPKLGLPLLPLAGDRAAERRHRVYLGRLREMERRIKAGKSPINYDWLLDARAHENDGPYWREKSAYPHLGSVTIPIFSLDHWGATHFVTGTLRGYQETAGPKKLALFPIEFVDHAQVVALGIGSPHKNVVDLEALQVRWFDHWLKGIDTGVMKEPPILLYTSGSETWSQETEWPLEGTDFQRWWLSRGDGGEGSLLPPEAVVDSGPAESIMSHDPDRPVLAPLDPSDRRVAERGALVFTSSVLQQPLRMTGPITLEVFVRATAEDFDLIVHVTDVQGDGASRTLSMGARKASHRESDEHPVPVVPGSICRYVIDVWPISHVILPGHRLRIGIAPSEHPTFEVSPLAASITVVHEAAHPSAVVLPVIPSMRARAEEGQSAEG
jgi:putative CocE/NonD family hydrolase